MLLHVERPTTCVMATARVSIHCRSDVNIGFCIMSFLSRGLIAKIPRDEPDMKQRLTASSTERM